MTDREFQIAFAPMIAHVGKQPTPEQLRYWHEMLDDLDGETVRRAIIATLRDYQFAGWPPVGIVRRNAGGASGSLQVTDRATIAWAAVKSAVAKHGGYATVEFDDPLTTATIRMLGGWVRICDTEAGEPFDVWLKKDFCQTYGSLMAAGVSAELTEPLAGLCDIANSATGHDRIAVASVPTGLPATPRGVIHGERKQAAIEQVPEVRRLASSMAVEPLPIQEQPPLPESLSLDEQREQLAKRFGVVRRIELQQNRPADDERREIDERLRRVEASE